MKVNSLAFRLFATAAGWSLLVLPLAAFVISSLYRQDVQADFDKRVRLLLTLIVADSLEKGGNAPGQPRGTGEPQFDALHSGWYWQIKPMDGASGKRLVSASLASETLLVPSDGKTAGRVENSGGYAWSNLQGPVGEPVRVAELVQLFGDGNNARRYSIAVAGPLGEVNQAVSNLRYRLLVSLALAGLGLLAVTLFQVRFGLAPLRQIERGLADIRSGGAAKLAGELPAEIEPLQHELNALIQSNQDIVDRARTQVGNLAHALKTPLAVITNEANDSKGRFAKKVAEQAQIMRDQVSHYLDRARIVARSGGIGRVTPVRPVAQALVRVLGKIHGDRGIEFSLDCPLGARFQGEKQDLEEMLGNLMDNAGKWARSEVRLRIAVIALQGQNRLRIHVEDDGPGLSREECKQAMGRGRRLDESVPGSGLGLSIVDDLAQSYRGSIALCRGGNGGLAAELDLPAA